MLSPPHRIRSQRWLVRTPSTANALALRKQLHDCWQESVLPVFEKVFDDAVDGEQIIHLPKIELHLQVANVEQLIELLPELIQQQLNNYMQSALKGPSPSGEFAFVWREDSLRQSRLDILLHYLRTGSLPWQAAIAATAETAIELKETCRQQWSQLLDLMRNKPEPAIFYFRLFQLISDENAVSLITSLIINIPQTWTSAMVQLITSLLVSGQRFFSRQTRIQLATTLLSESLSQQESSVAPDVVATLESFFPQHEKYAFNDFFASLPDSVAAELTRPHPNPPPMGEGTVELNSTASPPNFPNAVELTPPPDGGRLVGGRSNDSETTDLTHPHPIPFPMKEGTEALNTTVLGDAPRPVVEKESDNLYPRIVGEGHPFIQAYPMSGKRANDEFPLLVNHAGLILLNPYITRFFESTGIKQAGNAQLSPFLTARAAALLNYLATGREDVYEYELGFIKILLGLTPEMALPVVEGLIKPNDREEAEALLQSVIHYWSILKNTSIQGLRSSFLQRQGLLREDDDGWRLQVERVAYDMLLDQLPWGISIVKLPWMPKPIYTEWSVP